MVMEGPALTSTNSDGYWRGTAAALAGIPVSDSHAAKGRAKPCFGGWLRDPGIGLGFAAPALAEINEVLKKSRGQAGVEEGPPTCSAVSQGGRSPS